MILSVARVLRLTLNPKGLVSLTYPQRRGSDPSLVNHISRLPITRTPALAVMITAVGMLPWHGFAPPAANPLRLDPLVLILGLYAKPLDQRLILHIPSMSGFLANVDDLPAASITSLLVFLRTRKQMGAIKDQRRHFAMGFKPPPCFPLMDSHQDNRLVWFCQTMAKLATSPTDAMANKRSHETGWWCLYIKR